MAQKKIEAIPEVDVKTVPQAAEESIAEVSFVNTFWEQYELSQERARKLRESREDAYLNSVKEVIKFNKQYRKSVAKLYDQARKTNKEMVSEVAQQVNFRKEDAKDEAVPNNDREELKKQLSEVSSQLEILALTPVKTFFQFVEQMEDNFVKNTEAGIGFARERRNAWLQVRKEYVKLARNTHLDLVERGKNSLKELVKSN
ncbi:MULTISPECIES: hypothetical protein [Neobacillus]|uniref:Uncharacterized protein n=1 Tax=Neobacillus rhizophilus TaxID=2833579 RepID=A0A942YVY5_9BACI|nr:MULTISPECIES: hypothetical protein [Neobacillus]MBS4212071.1 hypothetical protein [Neobacillus rhizophilus]MBU8915503.1 hypothetical protein [Bacillus sp. FJAT-29953]